MSDDGTVTVIFEVPDMTAAQYDQIIQGLEDAGAISPGGRLYHVASPTDQGWYVLDVWRTAEEFNDFAGTLVPILGQIGITPPQPRLYPVYNIVQ